MNIFGDSICVYLQKEVVYAMDQAVTEKNEFFKSRSHFVNCACIRELRRLGIELEEVDVA